jgi:dipeptidyl aminopeptidase/acylaminoacyl peptidase
MRACVVVLLLASSCGLFRRDEMMGTGNPCVDDPTTTITVTPPMTTAKPGDRRIFEFQIMSRKGSATAEATFQDQPLERAGQSAVYVIAPSMPGRYEVVVTRVGCPQDRGTAVLTVEPLASLGKAPGQQPVPSGVSWSADSSTVAVSGRGGVWLFRADGTFLDSARIPHQGRTSVSWSPDGTRLAVGGDVSERTWIFQMPGFTPLTRVGVNEGSAGSLFSADGSTLFLHEGDAVQAILLSTGTPTRIGPVGETTVESDTPLRLQAGPFGTLLVSGPAELREISTGRRLARFNTPGTGLAIAPDGRWLFDSTGGLRLPFLEQAIAFGQGPVPTGGPFFTSAFTRDGTLLATGETGAVTVYRNDGATLTPVGRANLMNAPGPVADLAWSPDGARLAVAASSRLIILSRAQLGL